MSNNSASAIRTALNTHLSAVTQLKQVKIGRDYDPSSGFPFCRFYLVGVSSEPLDNYPTDYRTYRFAIDVFQEVSAKTKADAEADFEDAVDALMDKLNTKWQVPDGSNLATVDNSVVQSSFVTLQDSPTGPVCYLQLILECKTVIY